MKITMISNAMSHHQKPFCDAMSEIDSVEFRFIATKPLTSERKNMGYTDLNYSEDYIIRSFESEESYKTALTIANESDYVIYGSAPYEFVKNRICNNKWTFMYSERIFKKKGNILYKLKLFLIYYFRFGIHSKKRMKVLCASAYAPKDFSKLSFKQQQLYKWGYFPKQSNKELNDLLSNKKENSILWTARMIPWKHPETAVDLANRLKKADIPFHLTMIGNGEMYDEINSKIMELDLSDCVTLAGSLPTQKVRDIMEQAEVFIATSDQNEGWGAVINEAMSSACAVCAPKQMGAAPFLINNSSNGLMYNYYDVEALFNCVSSLLSNDTKREEIAKNAYLTINNKWNGNIAAKKLVELCKHISDNDINFSYPEEVCSLADIELND